MRTETTVSLSEELAAELSSQVPDAAQRSKFVETAVWAHLRRQRGRDASKDLAIINANAAELNAEAEDALSYQVAL